MTETDDKPLLVDTGKGFSVKWRNRFLYSSRNPLESVLKRVELWNPEENTLYLIPSPLLGYGLAKMAGKLPAGSLVLGVERFQELMALTQSHLPQELLTGDSCRIIRTEDPAAAGEYVARLDYSRFRRCRRVELTGGSRLAPDFYDDLEKELNRRIFTYWQTRASVVRMGPLWFSNIFRNLSSLRQNRKVSSLTVKGPIVLCGAGESLEESLPLLSLIRDKIFLCAVDTAYPVLTDRGIFPDAVFNLDGQFYNFYDFYHHKNQPLYLISDITSFPASLRLSGVIPLFFSSRFAPNDLFRRMEAAGLLPDPIDPLGSVGVTALSLSTMLGTGPYFLTGLDFSYRPGKSHSRGTVYHQLYLNRINRLLPDGGMTELSLRRPPRTAWGRISGRALRSDTVLEDYYRMFLDITARYRDRCFQLSGDYPTLGVLPADKETLEGLLNGEPSGHVLDSESRPACWNDFFRREASRLRRIISSWEFYEKANSPEELEELLRECDYLTLTTGIEKGCRNEVYFTQAVKNARQYLSYIDHFLSGEGDDSQ